MECHVSQQAGAFTLQASLLLPAECHWLGLFGPSGAGKSTLLRALAGLERTAEVNGQWGEVVLPDARQSVLVSAQTPLFPAISVAQNLHLVASHNQQSAAQTDWAIDNCECRQLLSKMPGALSGGELQRVKLARALLANPTLLLLDESFSAMDSALKQRIQWRLRYEWSGSARVIMVSHDINDMIRCCQQVALISAGSVVSQGDIATILGGQHALAQPDKPGEQTLPLASVLKGPFYAQGDAGIQFKVGQTIVNSSDAAVRDNTNQIAMLVPASQVVLSQGDETSLSLPNCLTGRVTAIESINDLQHKVSLLCADQQLIAAVDTVILAQMGLHSGDTVHAHFASRFSL
ncbi:ATP-binding cassette domain-containing protein [Alteromonas gilva]|uniref:ATP-binding cassette domain-containing protein n=1 Tax=Alteromonas gilva TaxID=2987522 RepID=A0ABT5L111_9ALTE|nr:ATP-binding cassette domain-containing protein [Alteromonas gilva]MDC8830734.1 ATP-binding cassette domain-containing protein [Alteromonas gilva]